MVIYHPCKYQESVYNDFWGNEKTMCKFLNTISHHRKWFKKKTFIVIVDICSPYHMCEIQVQQLIFDWDIRHWNFEVSFTLPEVDVTTSGGVASFRYFKRDLIKWCKFRFKRKSLKFSISFITSGDDRKWRPTC